jgi:hypothetical protein
MSPVVVWWLSVCHWTKVLGFKPGRGRLTFNGEKIHSTTSFEEGVKPSLTCSKILRHVKEPYSVKEIPVDKIHDISYQVSTAALPGVSASYGQRALVGESLMIRTQMGKNNRSVMVAMYGTPCAIPPRILGLPQSN